MKSRNASSDTCRISWPRPVVTSARAIQFLFGALVIVGSSGCSNDTAAVPTIANDTAPVPTIANDTAPVPAIAAADLASRIEDGTSPLILDVRTPEEFHEGHVPDAINIPFDELDQRLSEIPSSKSDEIVVHCLRGGRAGHAEEVLKNAGYTQVKDLEGHWEQWLQSGFPTQ